MPVIWLIEDNASFRRATERALNKHLGNDSARGFSCCEDAFEILQKGHVPDVVLLDVGLPGIDGISGIHQFKALAPDAGILILTVFEDDEKIFRAICAGASGYLLKSEPIGNITQAIDQVLIGGASMNPRVASRVLAMFSKLAPVKKDYGLTPREEAVLQLMVAGLVKKEIADKLDQNLHTVDYMMRCIYKKLHVNCQAAAVSKAVKDGLVQP